MKKVRLKILGVVAVFLLFVSITVSIHLIDNKVNNNENYIENNIKAEHKDYVINREITADLTVDYSQMKNLIGESDVVAIVSVESEEGKNYNPIKEKYVPVYTTGTLKVKEIVLDSGSTGIQIDDEIDYVRLGGTIEYSEYLKGLTVAEKSKLNTCVESSTMSASIDKSDILVKDIFVNDIEVQDDTEYMVFLKYSNDYQKYNIFGFEYGLREYDSTTNSIKNNESNQFESLNTLKQDIINEIM